MRRDTVESAGVRRWDFLVWERSWARQAFAADPGLHFTGLDHVEFTVSDVEKSLAFYVQISATG